MRPDPVRNQLSRLLAVQYRSLAMYLHDAVPWMHPGGERASETLGHIVSDQRGQCARIADYLIERFGRVDAGEFPLEFTGLNDCSLDYLVRELIAEERTIVATIEDCVRELQGDRAALALAEESLGAARGHLESLEELVGQKVAS